jgi:Rrf2 family protein
MRVGSRGDYGLRALLLLAQSGDAEPMQVHTIAERQQIPEDYLRQLLAQLRTAGLVKSVRGPHGGYLLAKPAQAITMSEVIEVLEGPPEVMHCRFHALAGDRCNVFAGCEIRGAWHKATQALHAVLTETTLADLMKLAPGP